MILASEVSLNADALSGLNLLVSFGLPLLVGVITRKITKPVIKRNLLYGLSVLTGTITTIIENGGTFDIKDTLLGIVVSYGVAQGGYSAILKPSGVADVVSNVTDKVGVGAVIAADPEAVALEAGIIVPAPTIVPAEQVVDSEGQQAEAIVESTDTEAPPEEDVAPQDMLPLSLHDEVLPLLAEPEPKKAPAKKAAKKANPAKRTPKK